MTVSLPATQHFTLHELAQGVYAAIASEPGFAISNAGIIELGERTLVFDTFLTPAAAEGLRRAAEQLTGKPVSLVINSHYHNDHIRGNQIFAPPAEIVSSTKTRQLFQTAVLDELYWDQENAPARLAVLKNELAAASDEATRQQIADGKEHLIWVTYFQAITDSLPELELRQPTITFDTEMAFFGVRRQARLVSYGQGHTEDDAFLYLPEDGIAFLSDLLFVGCHPYLCDGDPLSWVAYLRRIAQLGLHTFIPGHGPVGSQADLLRMIDYIETLQELVKQVVASGGEAEQAASLPIPKPFSTWQFPRFFAANMRFLWGKLAERA